ncbi:unnamed protein product [Bursaphelenchus xylophilus]|uniref:(pine wood nematode) hypothetical protein n=1 Tax=Bursaphelenchus xylophilus TaxID=6326 RepID=A0A811JWP5_BURXY|nr:unnamed protein product [Bursaphelenchus xylophilus]CAG9079652.1 unnamed protein product [Bursaphelenchus xylophilus]
MYDGLLRASNPQTVDGFADYLIDDALAPTRRSFEKNALLNRRLPGYLRHKRKLEEKPLIVTLKNGDEPMWLPNDDLHTARERSPPREAAERLGFAPLGEAAERPGFAPQGEAAERPGFAPLRGSASRPELEPRRGSASRPELEPRRGSAPRPELEPRRGSAPRPELESPRMVGPTVRGQPSPANDDAGATPRGRPMMRTPPMPRMSIHRRFQQRRDAFNTLNRLISADPSKFGVDENGGILLQGGNSVRDSNYQRILNRWLEEDLSNKRGEKAFREKLLADPATRRFAETLLRLDSPPTALKAGQRRREQGGSGLFKIRKWSFRKMPKVY